MDLERHPRLDTFLSSGIDAALVEPTKLRRIRITNVLTLTLIILTVPYVGLCLAMGRWTMASALVILMLICVGILLLLRWLRSPELSAHVLLASAFVMLIMANLSRGDLADASFGWLYLFPLAAILTTGLYGGWFWTGVTLVTAIGFWLLPPSIEISGITFSADSGSPVLIHRLAGPLAVALLVSLATYLQRQTEKSLESEIATRKRAEEEARTADRIKGEFLANVSHEIRTPMNGVIGMTDLLLKADMPASQRQQVEAINTSSETLLALVNDLLDFSKMEAGKLSLYVMDFRLRDLLENAVALLAPRAKEKKLDFRLVVDDDLPDDLVGDAQRLRQVLLNLLGNAIKFTSRGSVAVSVERQTRARKELWARFAVRDTGVGISSRDQRRLFAPFSQAESTSARRFGGTGLGLAISKSLVEMMGGEIGFESTDGVGSTFWFHLPLWPAQMSDGGAIPVGQRSDSQVSEPMAGNLQSARILVVDDDAINRLVASSQLEDLGFEHEAVENGVEALQKVDDQTFDAILMDCQMPELDGYETTRRIRRTEKSPERTVIIAVTAHAMKGERERCLASGMDDYVSKPLRGEDLRLVLDRWLLSGDGRGSPGSKPLPIDTSSVPDRQIVLDPAPLAAARKLGRKTGKDLAGQIIEIFRNEGPARVDKMQRALAEKDCQSMAEAAHSLGGSARYLGAIGLAKLCRELEEMLELEDLAGSAAGLQALEEEHQQVLEELGSQLMTREAR